MMTQIVESVAIIVIAAQFFLFGRIYEGKFGYWKKSSEAWKAVAYSAIAGWGEAVSFINEHNGKKVTDGESVPSPFYQPKK